LLLMAAPVGSSPAYLAMTGNLAPLSVDVYDRVALSAAASTKAAAAAGPTPAVDTARLTCCVVFGAGSPECNGVYVSANPAELRNDAPVFRMPGSGGLTLSREIISGRSGWIIGRGGTPFYGALALSLSPPVRSFVCFSAKPPTPMIDFSLRPVRLEGWVHKKGPSGGVAKWKKRWFRLSGTKLKYYELPTSPHPIDAIDLDAGLAVVCEGSAGGGGAASDASPVARGSSGGARAHKLHPHRFQLAHPGLEPRFLYVNSAEELAGWVGGLRLVLEVIEKGRLSDEETGAALRALEAAEEAAEGGGRRESVLGSPSGAGGGRPEAGAKDERRASLAVLDARSIADGLLGAGRHVWAFDEEPEAGEPPHVLLARRYREAHLRQDDDRDPLRPPPDARPVAGAAAAAGGASTPPASPAKASRPNPTPLARLVRQLSGRGVGGVT
jgi:hypothetical protein